MAIRLLHFYSLELDSSGGSAGPCERDGWGWAPPTPVIDRVMRWTVLSAGPRSQSSDPRGRPEWRKLPKESPMVSR